jgi:hypothetical protein
MRLLLGHLVEDLCRLWEIRAQPVGIGAIDTAVILFGGDGERQDFLLAE